MTYALESLSDHVYYSDEDQPLEVLIENSPIDVAFSAIQRVVVTYENAREAQQQGDPSADCCFIRRRAPAASLLGAIIMIAASAWVPMAIKNELEDHLLTHTLSKSSITKFCLEGFGVTFGSHSLGQITTWATEYLRLHKPVLSLCEYGLLTRSLCKLKSQGQDIADDSPYITGKKIFWKETRVYVRNLSHFLILGFQAVALYLIWAQTVALVDSNFDTKSYTSEEADSMRSLGNHTLSFPDHHLQETITQTFSLGIFTGAISPATVIILRIMCFAYSYFRSMSY